MQDDGGVEHQLLTATVTPLLAIISMIFKNLQLKKCRISRIHF